MKILVIRFSSIGDIVLTTPVIRTLKTQLQAEVHFLTKRKYQEVISENPYIDQIHLLDDSLLNTCFNLRLHKFDAIIDLHVNLRSVLVKSILLKKSYSFKKLNFKKWLLTAFNIDILPSKHIVDRYIEAVSPLGVKMDELGLDYFIAEKDEIENSWLPVSHQNGYAAVVVGAMHRTKRLPVKRLIELCDRINKPIVLIGGEQEIPVGKEIEDFFKHGTVAEEEEINALEKKTTIFNACGKFNLGQSSSVVKNAAWVFTHDTGMMHIAAAFKKKIYSIWGSTSPKFGMYPYRTSFVVFENNKIKCRPCSKIGFDKCPKGHFKCMNELTFDFYLPD